MIKLTRDKSGHLIVQSMDGRKLVIKEYEKGFKFKSKWWPREESANLMVEIEQELDSII